MIVPMNIKHFLAVQPRKFDQLCMGTFEEMRNRAETAIRSGDCFAQIVNGEVVAVGGVVILWSGVGEAWAVTSSLAEKYFVGFHRATIKNLGRIIRKHRLHRLQATVHERHEKSLDWVKRLGFEREGVLQAYGPDGGNYFMYARLT